MKKAILIFLAMCIISMTATTAATPVLKIETVTIVKPQKNSKQGFFKKMQHTIKKASTKKLLFSDETAKKMANKALIVSVCHVGLVTLGIILSSVGSGFLTTILFVMSIFFAIFGIVSAVKTLKYIKHTAKGKSHKIKAKIAFILSILPSILFLLLYGLLFFFWVA